MYHHSGTKILIYSNLRRIALNFQWLSTVKNCFQVTNHSAIMVPRFSVRFHQLVRYTVMYWTCRSTCCISPLDTESIYSIAMHWWFDVCDQNTSEGFCAIILIQSGQLDNIYEPDRRQQCDMVVFMAYVMWLCCAIYRVCKSYPPKFCRRCIATCIICYVASQAPVGNAAHFCILIFVPFALLHVVANSVTVFVSLISNGDCYIIRKFIHRYFYFVSPKVIYWVLVQAEKREYP
jgi:hypothetical protein